MSNCLSLLWALAATARCATCPKVAMGEARPTLLGHRSIKGIAAVGRLLVAIEGYIPLVQMHFVVVYEGLRIKDLIAN
jgi:hypothetical protein